MHLGVTVSTRSVAQHVSSQAYNYNNIRGPLPIIGLGQTRELNLPGQNISTTVSKYFLELQFTMALWEVGDSIIMFSILRKTTSPHGDLKEKYGIAQEM